MAATASFSAYGVTLELDKPIASSQLGYGVSSAYSSPSFLTDFGALKLDDRMFAEQRKGEVRKAIHGQMYAAYSFCSVEKIKELLTTWNSNELVMGCVAGLLVYMVGPINISFLLASIGTLVFSVHLSYLKYKKVGQLEAIKTFVVVLGLFALALLFSGFIDLAIVDTYGMEKNYRIMHTIVTTVFLTAGVIITLLYLYSIITRINKWTRLTNAIDAFFKTLKGED